MNTLDNPAHYMLYIHLDEINHLHKSGPKVFKTAVRLLSDLQSSTVNNGNIFYNVLFTGTSYIEIKNYLTHILWWKFP
jgi:hypothetical protein